MYLTKVSQPFPEGKIEKSSDSCFRNCSGLLYIPQVLLYVTVKTLHLCFTTKVRQHPRNLDVALLLWRQDGFLELTRDNDLTSFEAFRTGKGEGREIVMRERYSGFVLLPTVQGNLLCLHPVVRPCIPSVQTFNPEVTLPRLHGYGCRPIDLSSPH